MKLVGKIPHDHFPLWSALLVSLSGVIYMIYKRVGYGKHRYLIVDWESYGTKMRVTSNLLDDQFKIELLMAENCPIRTSCVRLEEGISSICIHLGSFPMAEDSSINFTEVTCLYGGEPRPQKVGELWVEGCPLGKNCAACKDLHTISIPTRVKPDKSHAYITCRTRPSPDIS